MGKKRYDSRPELHTTPHVEEMICASRTEHILIDGAHYIRRDTMPMIEWQWGRAVIYYYFKKEDEWWKGQPGTYQSKKIAWKPHIEWLYQNNLPLQIATHKEYDANMNIKYE